MAASSDEMGALLIANGLGSFAQVFASEQITLETASDLTMQLLKELGIPMGPRMKILRLFATKPNKPDGLAGSLGSPRHMALLQASIDVPVDVLAASGKKFGCFLSHHKAACAMEGERANQRW
jgi:hypothetical protein